jgi:hypothetical protein
MGFMLFTSMNIKFTKTMILKGTRGFKTDFKGSRFFLSLLKRIGLRMHARTGARTELVTQSLPKMLSQLIMRDT